METDKSIQNQKVFVKLQAVLQLQAEYHQTLNAQRGAAPDSITQAELTAKRQAIENAIVILELPIQVTGTIGREGQRVS
jgi:hypothetical protein